MKRFLPKFLKIVGVLLAILLAVTLLFIMFVKIDRYINPGRFESAPLPFILVK